jgi:hypothetical protein
VTNPRANDRNPAALAAEVSLVIEAAYALSEDIGAEVEAALAESDSRPLDESELHTLLTRVINVMLERAVSRGRPLPLDGDVAQIVDRIVRESRRDRPSRRRSPVLTLQARNGIVPGPVFPTPMFHGKEIPMRSGWVRTADIRLWEDNERLEIHVAQFTQRNGRPPTSDELLQLMLSVVPLPGITVEDQFHIRALARSIATNGVQKPPIIALDGTLLDGNRRLAACNFILRSDEFTTEQKKRAEWLFVWQLTEHATDDDRDRVVVALNFESDYKEQWPEYIKARKVYQEWEAMLALESPAPNNRRQGEMKCELSVRFALGPTAHHVNRYIKMMDWADKFESYHIGERRRDKFEVQHRASEWFQYFEELGKGQAEGGVANVLNRDDPLRHAVFDLLYDGRFRNWTWIRALKDVAVNDDARELLFKARNETDPDLAEDHLEQAISLAKARRAEERKVGANTRIESFVKWLLDVPVGAFSDGTIQPRNLQLLLDALRRVEEVTKAALEDESDAA